MADVRNLTAADPDGTLFGQSSTDLIGMYGKTPLAQQTAAAVGTDAGTTQTLANAIRTALINIGLWKA